MATSIGKHVRLRIFFEDADLPPSWLLVNFSSIATIDDLKKHICLRFLNQDHDLKLSLDGCILPGIERSIILRDNDYVHVRILGHKSSANTSYFNEEVLQTDKTVSNIHKDAEEDKTDKKKKKKDKKHKHKTSKNSPINEELAKSEENSKKTKRKKHTYNCEDQNSDNSCSGLPKKRKLDSSKSKINEGLLPSLKSCDPMCSTPDVSIIPMEAGGAAKASTSVQKVEKGDDGAENTADSSKKGKRRRKRTRNRKNNKNSEEKTATDKEQVKPGVSKPASVPWMFQKKTGVSGFNSGSNNKHKVFSSDEDTSESDKEGETTHGHESVNTVEDSCEKNRFNGASTAKNYTTCTTTDNSSFTHTNEDENDRSKSAELQKKKQEALSRVQEIEIHQQYGDSNCLEDSVEGSSSSYSSSTVTTSLLPNGVPVYSRQRQRKQNTNRYELTKQQQLNTKLTNRSVVLKGTPERMKAEAKAADTEQQNSFQNEEVSEDVPMTYEAIPIGKEYSRFPALQGTPRCGDNIAFKVLEMSADYTPEVSKYKEGVVLNFDHDSMTVNVELTATEAERRPQGKFEVVFDGEEPWSDHTPDDKVSYPWNSLLEPRILT